MPRSRKDPATVTAARKKAANARWARSAEQRKSAKAAATINLLVPHDQHAKFKAKCALAMTSMRNFLLGKIDEFVGAE
jgi:hypothetical protein